MERATVIAGGSDAPVRATGASYCGCLLPWYVCNSHRKPLPEAAAWRARHLAQPDSCEVCE